VVEIAINSVPALLMVSDMRASYLPLIPKIYDWASAEAVDRMSAMSHEIATALAAYKV
jgi:hypothetical protein